MSVPQQRNMKKSRRKVHRYPSSGRTRLLTDERPAEDYDGDDIGGSIEDMRGPGSWLENEYFVEQQERLLSGFSNHRRSFLNEPTFDEDDGLDSSDYEDFDDYF